MTAAKHLNSRVATAFFGQFQKLREGQEAAIEPILAGRNVVLSSGTGSGKTEGALAPLLSRYWLIAAESASPVVLYVAPTKALINDLDKRLSSPLQSLGLRAAVRHGDRDDLASAKQPCQVLLTTPESLDVLLFRGDVALSTVRAVVIDEVHLLYNTQRGLQLSILIQRLRRRIALPIQWAALSATLGQLEHVRDFLFGVDEDAAFLSFPPQRRIDAQVRHAETEDQFVTLVRRLTDVAPTKLLVFANARKECERLANALMREPRLASFVFAHYSSLSPELRVDTERRFATAATALCVATSTLELGIDIGDIDAVILWGPPTGVESFLQRIGRGNRRSSKTNVICVVRDDSTHVVGDALQFMALIDAAVHGNLPVRAPFRLFGAAAQQSASIIGSKGGSFTRVAEIVESFAHQTHLDRHTVESILNELAAQGCLQRHGFKNQFGADERLHELVDFRMIFGNYPTGSQTVDVYHGSQLLGCVPMVNLLRLQSHVRIRFAGKCWSVGKASRDRIQLLPARSGAGATDFVYATAGHQLDGFVAQRMWHVLHSSELADGLLTTALAERVARFRERLVAACTVTELPYVRTPEGICYYTFAGRAVNKAIGLVSKKPGFRASEVLLVVPSPINWSTVPTNPADYEGVWDKLCEESSAQSVFQQLLPQELQIQEFVQEWLNDQTIRVSLSRLASAKPIEVPATVMSDLA